MSVPLSLAPYLEAAGRGVLVLPRCEDCGRHHFYPRPACPHCGGSRLEWREVSGRATVYSFSVVHRPPTPAFAAAVPYTIAIVETDEGPHLMSRIVGVAPGDVTIGLRVAAQFETFGDASLPVFTPEGRG